MDLIDRNVLDPHRLEMDRDVENHDVFGPAFDGTVSLMQTIDIFRFMVAQAAGQPENSAPRIIEDDVDINDVIERKMFAGVSMMNEYFDSFDAEKIKEHADRILDEGGQALLLERMGTSRE